MRDALLQLAMTGAGRTTSYNPSGSGGEIDYTLVNDHGRGLRRGDAPHLEYAARWDAAGDDDERAAVLEAARSELDRIRRSRADPGAIESKKDRDRRIVEEGENWPLNEVARAFRTGVVDVRKARQAAGREIEYGRRPRNGRELSADERRAEILRLHGEGLTPSGIAEALQIPRSSVRYVLARPRA